MNLIGRLSGIRDRARTKGLAYDLTQNWLRDKVSTGVCDVTGIKFNTKEANTITNPYYPSIDRIDSNKGYTEDNCQLVVFIYNVLKADNKESDIKLFAEKFIETYEKENI